MNQPDKIRIVAIVPMRHSSERVPGKNYRDFAGEPLFHHIVQSLLSCDEIDQVVIDTDSEAIHEDVRAAFPGVTVLERPEHLRDGMIPMNEVLLNTTAALCADYFLQTHSTNPLLTSATIAKAISCFLAGLESYDSLFSVTRLQSRLWDQKGRPVNHDPDRLIRTQDLTPMYEENSCLYIFSRQSLLAKGNRIGAAPLMFEIDPVEAWDIDVETDFRIAELLYQARAESGKVCQ